MLHEEEDKRVDHRVPPHQQVTVYPSILSPPSVKTRPYHLCVLSVLSAHSLIYLTFTSVHHVSFTQKFGSICALYLFSTCQSNPGSINSSEY